MSTSILLNGITYTIPAVGEESWGTNLSTYFIAIPQGVLQKTGGTFTLSADVNFGANFGILSKYFSTRTALPSTAGLFRLAISDTIGWRNTANSGNLLLSVNGSDQLTFNGTAIYPAGITALTGDVTASGPGSVAATVAAIRGQTVVGTTGTTNSVFSASPTFTGTVTASALTATGAISFTTPLGIASGGTGQATANAAFNALSPMTTGGDIIYGGASGAGTRLGNGLNGQVLTSSGGTAAPRWGDGPANLAQVFLFMGG